MEQEHLDFADFYQARHDDCLRAVLAAVGDRPLAEDLVADSFSRAWSSWSRVCRHPAPHAWVVRTALNIRVSWWRRRRREVPLNGQDAPGRPALADASVDAALLAAVRRLPKRQKQVIALRVFLDLDAQTTADVLGITANTVAVHLFRAIAQLRGHFAAVEHEEMSR